MALTSKEEIGIFSTELEIRFVPGQCQFAHLGDLGTFLLDTISSTIIYYPRPR